MNFKKYEGLRIIIDEDICYKVYCYKFQCCYNYKEFNQFCSEVNFSIENSFHEELISTFEKMLKLNKNCIKVKTLMQYTDKKGNLRQHVGQMTRSECLKVDTSKPKYYKFIIL